MAKYRTCRIQPAHFEPFWVVEKLTFGFWWRRQKHFVWGCAYGHWIKEFKSEKQAQNWIDLDKQGSLHSCGPVQ